MKIRAERHETRHWREIRDTALDLALAAVLLLVKEDRLAIHEASDKVGLLLDGDEVATFPVGAQMDALNDAADCLSEDGLYGAAQLIGDPRRETALHHGED